MSRSASSISRSTIVSPDTLPRRTFQILTVCSGKGGVGKTMTTVNMSVVLAQAGWQLTVLDGDPGLGNVKLMLPISPSFHLGQWLTGESNFEQLVTSTPAGFKVISAPPDEFQLNDLSDGQKHRLAELVDQIQQTSDLLIIDNAAGISRNVVGWCRMAHRLLLVTTPDPTAMMDAYATIRAFSSFRLPPPVGIIVNQARSGEEGFDTYKRLNTAASRFVGIDAAWLGYIGGCRDLRLAIKNRIPPVTISPHSPFSRSVRKTTAHVARWLLDENMPTLMEDCRNMVKKSLNELREMAPALEE
jgi:flagellar biosynthesis protein FlhG